MRTLRTCAVAVHRAVMRHQSALIVIAAISVCVGVSAPAHAGGVNGACCLPDGSCVDISDLDCTPMGGSFQGPGSMCADVMCPPPSDCVGEGDCFEANGTPSCESEECCDIVCGMDAFCCDTLWDAVCVRTAFLFCPAADACCFPDGSCQLFSPARCLELGGVPQGGLTECGPSLCPQPMVCCFPDGACTVVIGLDCVLAGGVPQADQTVCDLDSCPPFGACCYPDGICDEIPEFNCTLTRGAFQGSFTDCLRDGCPQAGACCFANGACLDELPLDCAKSGGEFQGEGILCGGGTITCTIPECPGIGNCFSNNGSPGCDDATCCSSICIFDSFCCDTLWDTICADAASTDAFCVQAACCMDDGSCMITISPDCTNMGGTFQAGDDTCSPNPCPQPGACCFDNGTCVDATTATTCTDMGGTYEGNGTNCDDGTASCQNPVCPGSGDCLERNGTLGCENAACCNLICTLDPFCCNVEWDSKCADEAATFCTLLPCPWDCTPANGDGTFGNGVVNVDDIVKVIVEFGSANMECDSAPDNMDGTFGNGVINVDDLVDTIVNFGECP
ncbi:MAG: hypothetical protein AAF432_13155 [Planctomycetota bacterium]